jgi:hypothetical protein
MISNEVIEPCRLFFRGFAFEVYLPGLDLKNFIPFLLEILSVDEFPLFYADLEGEHRGVSPNSDFDVDFAHFPLKLVLREVGNVFGEESKENIADIS